VACGTLSNATTYSFSCFIKTPTNSLTSVWLYISDGGGGTGGNRWGVEVNLTDFTLTDFTLNNGSVTSKAVENYGNGWYRVRVTGQVTSGMSGSSVAVVRKLTAGADTNGINGVLVWGAQFETGSIATSYIPTTTAPITRGAETCTATIGPLNVGSLYISISDNDPQPGPGTHVFGPLAVLGASPLALYVSRSNNTRNRLWTQASNVIYTTSNNNLRLAFTWDQTNVNVFENGAKVLTNFAYAITGVHTIRFGPTEVRNHITALAVYPNRLSDAQLQALTT
jgi:hypothetical protein